MEKEYCTDCGIELNEGEAKTFTVCDDCWNHHYKKMQMKPNQTEGSTGVEDDDIEAMDKKFSESAKKILDTATKNLIVVNKELHEKHAACLAALKELIPLADGMVFEMYATVPDEVIEKAKSAIGRAKRITNGQQDKD